MSRHHIHLPNNLGDHASDIVARIVGSWKFIIGQTIIVICWMVANLYLLSRPFDPYPFILLNLAFSTQAAYAAPIIQMSSNRQATKDRLRDDLEAQEVHQLNNKMDEIINLLKVKNGSDNQH